MKELPRHVRYHRFEPLGEGGDAQVFHCRDRVSGQSLVYKWYFALHGRRGVEEGRKLSRIAHPGVTSVLDYGFQSDEGRSYLVTAYAPGAPFVEAVDGCEAGRKLYLYHLLCTAVQYLHGLGVVHRDLKSANVLVVGDRPLIIDFGAASELGYDQAFQGTLPYAAPELFSRLSVDFSADLYSLGVLLHRLLVGGYPRWAEDFDGWQQVHARRESCKVDPTGTLSASLGGLIERLLAYDPPGRGTIDQLVLDLEEELTARQLLFEPASKLNAGYRLARLDLGHLEQVRQEVRRAFLAPGTETGTVAIVALVGETALQREALERAILEELREDGCHVGLQDPDELETFLLSAPPGTRSCSVSAEEGAVPRCLRAYEQGRESGKVQRALILVPSADPTTFARYCPTLVVGRSEAVSPLDLLERNFPLQVERSLRYRARLEGTNSLPELLSLLGTELGEGRLRWDARGWHLGEDRLESLSAGGDEHRIENGAGPAHEDDGSGYLAECLALLGGEDAEATVPFLLGRLFQRGLYEVLERCCALVSARSHEDRCTAFATLYLARTAAVRGQDQAAEELLQALPREAGEELELERAIVAATLAGRKGDFDRAEHLLLENLHHPGRDRYPHALSNTLLNVGIIRAKRGEYDKALACYYDALELKRRHADPSGVVSLYSNLGACHHLRGDAEAALVHYRRAAAEAQRIGDLKSYAIASFNQGDLLLDRGELNEAGTVLKAAGSMAERLGLEPVAERAALNLCFLEALSGTPQGEALRRLGEAETTARARGHVEQELLAIVLQGKTLQAHGNLGAAVADYRRALRRALEIRHSRLIREIDRLLSDAERAAATAAAPEVPGEPSGGGVPSKAVTLDGAEASDGLLLVWNSSRVLRETQPEPERLRDLLGYFTEVLGFARAAYVVREAAGQWTGLGLGYDGGQILELGQKLPLEGLLRPGPYPRLVGNLELLEGLTEEVDGSRFGLKTVLVAWFPALLPRGLYLDHRFLAPAGFLTPAKRALLESVLGLLTQGWTGPGGLPPSPGNREALVQPPQSSRERTVALLSRSITFSLTDRVLGREPQRIGQLGYLVGTSRPLEDLYRRMEQVAPTDVPVLLLGESGVGKEVVARGLHDLSGRRDHSLVIQNCAAIPEALAESILFGHVKGAFTGAHEDRAGVLAEADRGTLFLDEVGELPLPLQATLLRVLQDRRVRPVGGQGERAVDFRLLAATNRPLRDLVEGGTFREDLYFRLQVVVLRVPPLRERREDIPLLVEYFNTTESQALGLKALTFSTGAMEVLLGHPWPGNVRELKNVINRLLVFSQGARVDAEQVGRQFECDRPPRETAMREASGPLRQYLQRKERAYIEQTLEQTQGNVTVAAERLGMSRVNLYGRLRALGLPLPERGGRGKKDR